MEGEPYIPADAAEPEASASLGSFVGALEQSGAPADATLRTELAAECATVLDAFSRATDAVGLREAMALAGLLARRTADLGASGVVLSSVLDALLETVVTPLSSDDASALRGLMIEAYAAARLERDRERELAHRARATRPFVIAPRCVALVLQGRPDADWISSAVESLGPAMLRADARAVLCVAHFSEEPSEAALAEISSLLDVAAIVGARVFFAAQEELARTLGARLGDRARVFAGDAAHALEEALAVASSGPTDLVRARVAGLLKRLGV